MRRYVLTLICAITATIALAAFSSAAERNFTPVPNLQLAAAKAKCIKCTTRCSQCSNSSQCFDACRRNGDPLVRANSPCGSWYQTC